MKYADFTWLSKQYVRGFQGTRTGGTWGPVWDKSLLIVSLYRNGIGAKEISRFLFGTTKELPAVLNCVKAYGVFEIGRKSPASFKPRPPEEAVALKRTKEYDRQCSLAFLMERRDWIRGVKAIESASQRSENKWSFQRSRHQFCVPQQKAKRRAWRRFNNLLKRKARWGFMHDEMLGCSPNELRNRIEANFAPEWNWGNRGTKWHIDHIIPCAAFDFTKPEEIRRCFHFSNLRPLCRLENIRKSDLLPDGVRASDKVKAA